LFRDKEEIRSRIRGIIERFRSKGAFSPEKAMTLSELGLPPRFEEAMHRRLGQTDIFVEVNGKYYLNEERLKQIQEQRVKEESEGSRSDSVGGSYGKGNTRSWMRLVGVFLMLPIGLIVSVLLYYFVALSGGGYYPGEFLTILLVIGLGLFVVRLLFRRSRRNYWRGQYNLKDEI
jgi:hypothetical protein